MIAWIFPGQGSQHAGMGVGLTSDAAERVFESASAILGWDVRSIGSDGSPRRLDQTECTQPAVFTVSVAAAATLMARGLRPDLVAGHSVGDFAALVVAEAISFEDGLRAVAVRADAMGRAGRSREGGMAAVVGLDADRVESLCAATGGSVAAANFNAPDQVVVSGEAAALADVAATARALGARVVRLNVSVAAHSPVMQDAAGELTPVLNRIRWASPAIPVVTSVTGSVAPSAEDVPELLVHAVTQPVRWTSCVETLVEAGARLFVEVGPRNVLSGLVRRIAPEVETVQVEDDAGVDELAQRFALHAEQERGGRRG
jgi:[acyl-carrier-protein] S-malonyltransferase